MCWSPLRAPFYFWFFLLGGRLTLTKLNFPSSMSTLPLFTVDIGCNHIALGFCFRFCLDAPKQKNKSWTHQYVVSALITFRLQDVIKKNCFVCISINPKTTRCEAVACTISAFMGWFVTIYYQKTSMKNIEIMLYHSPCCASHNVWFSLNLSFLCISACQKARKHYTLKLLFCLPLVPASMHRHAECKL